MWWFYRKGPSGFAGASTAEEVTAGVDGRGLVAVITGAYTYPPRPASSCRRSLSIHESIPWRSEFAMKITSGLAGVGTTAN